jgi:hypothetical protein
VVALVPAATDRIDLGAIRTTIDAMPAEGPGVIVTRRWLDQVELELACGRAAAAMLQAIGATKQAARDGLGG